MSINCWFSSASIPGPARPRSALYVKERPTSISIRDIKSKTPDKQQAADKLGQGISAQKVGRRALPLINF